jgi:hypothetical protein
MPKKQLLVASVYGPSERSETWIDLQLKFLHRTTVVFDHAVYLNRVSAEMFPHSTIIQRYDLPFKSGTTDHSRGLNEIVKFFRRNPGYEHYLILDSDAFPIMDGWLEKLLVLMKGNARAPDKQFAAAVRAENLDTFPHPSAFFIRGEFLRQRNWDFRRPSSWRRPRRPWRPWRPYRNLLGVQLRPVGSGISPHYRGRHVLLPLLRTNVWNPHPILAAIYGGMFYHHGAGSRGSDLRFRLETMGLVDHLLPPSATKDIEEQLFAALVADPEGLIARLTGRISRLDPTFDFSGPDHAKAIELPSSTR